MEDISNETHEPINCIPINEYINNVDIIPREYEPIKCNC